LTLIYKRGRKTKIPSNLGIEREKKRGSGRGRERESKISTNTYCLNNDTVS